MQLIEEMLNTIDIRDIIKHYGEIELMKEMGYEIEYCFETDSDIKEYVLDNACWLGIPLAEDFNFNIIEQDLYDRFLDILIKNKANYEDIDRALKNYE